jgi:hypothetical protein
MQGAQNSNTSNKKKRHPKHKGLKTQRLNEKRDSTKTQRANLLTKAMASFEKKMKNG